MKIWWCAVHKMAAAEPESEEPNDCPAMFLGWMHGKPCQLVPMRLIPDNAETVDREGLAAALKLVEKKALRYPGPWLTTWYAARAYLTALDGETP